jgi:hypothetical protein
VTVRDQTRPENRCSELWSTFGPHAIGSERFATVSSGASFAQVAGAILRKRVRVQIPDKDAVARARRSCHAS